MVEIFDPLGVRRRFDDDAIGGDDGSSFFSRHTPGLQNDFAAFSDPQLGVLPDQSQFGQPDPVVLTDLLFRPDRFGRFSPPTLRTMECRPGECTGEGGQNLPFVPSEQQPEMVLFGNRGTPNIGPGLSGQTPGFFDDPDLAQQIGSGFIDPTFARPLPRRGNEDRFRLPVGTDGRIDERQLVPGRRFVADTDGTEWRYNGDKFVKQSSPKRRLTLRQMQKRATGQGPTAVSVTSEEMQNRVEAANSQMNTETSFGQLGLGTLLGSDGSDDPIGQLAPNMGLRIQDFASRTGDAIRREKVKATTKDLFDPGSPALQGTGGAPFGSNVGDQKRPPLIKNIAAEVQDFAQRSGDAERARRQEAEAAAALERARIEQKSKEVAAQQEEFNKNLSRFEQAGNALSAGFNTLKTAVRGLGLFVDLSKLRNAGSLAEHNEKMLVNQEKQLATLDESIKDPVEREKVRKALVGNIKHLQTEVDRLNRNTGLARGELGGQINRIAKLRSERDALPKNPAAEAALNAESFEEAWEMIKIDPAGVVGQFALEAVPPAVVAGGTGAVGGVAGAVLSTGAAVTMEMGIAVVEEVEKHGGNPKNKASFEKTFFEHEPEISEALKKRGFVEVFKSVVPGPVGRKAGGSVAGQFGKGTLLGRGLGAVAEKATGAAVGVGGEVIKDPELAPGKAVEAGVGALF